MKHSGSQYYLTFGYIELQMLIQTMDSDYPSSEASSCAAEIKFYFLQDLAAKLERERQEREKREQEIRKEKEEKVYNLIEDRI